MKSKTHRKTTFIAGFCATLLLGGTPNNTQANDSTTETNSDSPRAVLEKFLWHLSQNELEKAYALVAPSSKSNGDPIAYHAPLDYNSFTQEVTTPAKFQDYQLGKNHWENPHCFRQIITLQSWDTDETMLVYENQNWYVADPIHIIR